MAEQAKVRASAPVTTGETVVVACKLPHGYILRTFTEANVSVNVFGSVRTEKQWPADEKTFEINGNAHPQDAAPRVPITERGEFALTRNVPKDLWDKWWKQNQRLPVVENGLIFAFKSEGEVRAEAKKNEDVKSGLERLDVTKLPKDIGKISTAEEQVATIRVA